MNKYIIRIKLLSDLSTLSGASFGQSVDAEVCYDEKGLPFIPAKRIKGLLLEAAQDYFDIMGRDDIEKYFGVEDSGDNPPIIVSNAYLEDENRTLSRYYHTEVRTRTAIDHKTQTAKETSLRSSEVVHRNQSFLFEMETLLNEEELKGVLGLIRHMGQNRSRGLGEVSFLLEGEAKEDKKALPLSLEEGKNLVRLDVIAEDDLLLPSQTSGESGSMIPGSSLLGFFAYRYRNKEGFDENEFKRLFIKGDIHFYGGFPCSNFDKPYFPIPSFILKEKMGNGRYFNGLFEWKGDGIKRKPVHDGYCYYDGESLDIVDLEYTYHYHHSRDKEKQSSGQVKEFFQFNALMKGTRFQCYLEGDKKDLETLLEGLNYLRIGKSKTAQYGRLSLVGIKVVDKKKVNSSDLVVRFLTPTILLSSLGSPDYGDETILKALGLKGKVEAKSVRTILQGGYSQIWNKPKLSFEAIAPGSYMRIHLDEPANIDELSCLGLNTSEGNGLIKFDDASIYNVEIALIKANKKEEAPKHISSPEEDALIDFNEYGQGFCKKVTSSLIGRILLGISQLRRDEKFEERVIKPIKDDKKREFLEKTIVNYLRDRDYPSWDKEEAYLKTFLALAKFSNRNKDDAYNEEDD